MSPKKVVIVFLDGSYSIREYLSAEIARYHAGVACEAYPTAAVRLGDLLLRDGSLVDSGVRAVGTGHRTGTTLLLRLRVAV